MQKITVEIPLEWKGLIEDRYGLIEDWLFNVCYEKQKQMKEEQRSALMKFVYFNDTEREISIHPATKIHGTVCDMEVIKPYEKRVFNLPEGTYPFVKMWDYGESGLQILVSPNV